MNLGQRAFSGLNEADAVLALRWAWVLPRISERRPSLMARPAASSAARLMRKPDDSFSRLF